MENQSTVGCEWCVEGLQADGETPCPCQIEDLPRQVRDLKRAITERDEYAKQLERERDGAVALLNAQIEGHRLSARNATRNLIRATTVEARAEHLEKALRALEEANNHLAAGRPQAAYNALVDAGQAEALIALDNARRAARAALQQEGGR